MRSEERSKKESRLVSGDEEELPFSVINRVVSISELEEGSGVAFNKTENFRSKSVEAEEDLDGYDDEDEDINVNPYFDLQALRHHYPVRSHLVFLWKGARHNPASNKHLSKLPLSTVVATIPASADEYDSDSSTSSDDGRLSECPRFNSFLSRGYSSFVYVCCKHYFVVLCLYMRG